MQAQDQNHARSWMIDRMEEDNHLLELSATVLRPMELTPAVTSPLYADSVDATETGTSSSSALRTRVGGRRCHSLRNVRRPDRQGS